MTASTSTQPTIQEEVDKRLRTQQVQAMVQTQSEITPIPKEREAEFREWVRTHNIKDLDHPNSHYDYRGAFLARVEPDAQGHWPDTFKQHGHESFTVESQYSKGPQDGGHWEGEGPNAKFVATPLTPSSSTGPAPQDPLTDHAAAAFGRFVPASDPDANILRAFKQAGDPAHDHAVRAFRRITGEQDTAAVLVGTQQRPNFPIHFPEEEHVGPFGNVVQQMAQGLKDLLIGSAVIAKNVALHPLTPPGEILKDVSEEQRKQARLAGQLIASSLIGGLTSSAILAKMPAGLAKTFLEGSTLGAVFTTLEAGEHKDTLLKAFAVNAVLFGGMGMAGGLVGKVTKPINVGVEGLEKAGIPVGAGKLEGVEYGKSLFEEINGISEALKTDALTKLPDLIKDDIAASIAQVPANIGLLRRFLGSPTRWKSVGGPVGEAAERITTNATQRMAVGLRLRGEWEATLKEAERVLLEDISYTSGAGQAMTEGARKAFIALRKEQLGELLDNVFQPANLPVTAPPGMARAFTLLRNRLMADREMFRLLFGAAPDYGIDAYLPHVFVGEWAVVDATSGAIRGIAEWGNIKSTVAKLIADDPALSGTLRIVPKRFAIPSDFAGFGLSPRSVGIFINKSARTLGIDADEVASVVFENRLVRVKPGKKWFGHTQARGEPALQGFETDPFVALRIYAAGASRKMAFHDFEQKASAILESLARNEPGAKTSVDVLKAYVDRVMGRPSIIETALRGTIKEINNREVAQQLRPGMRFIYPMLGKVAQWEALARLGYSPVAWFLQLSQTLVNTSSAIGWGPTMRGVRLFLDRSQRQQVDAILRALDIDLAVPLSAADQIVTRNVGEVSPFHPTYLFNKGDVANRAIAGLAKYQEQILKGAGIRESLDAARQFVRETQFDYSIADAPALLSGPLGSTVFQFKKFLIKELEFIGSISTNPAALARFMTNMWAVGGTSALFSLPPLMLADWATGYATGETINERIQAQFPRASRGLPGFAGVDFGGSVALGVPRETGDFFGPAVTDVATLAFSVAPKWLIDKVRGKQGHLTPSDKAEAIAQLVPVMVRRLMDAYHIMENSTVNARSTHALQLRPENVEREAVLAAFGFRSLPRAEEARVYATQQRRVGLQTLDEHAAVQAMVDAYFDGDMERLAQIRADAQEAKLFIGGEQLQRAIQQRLVERTILGVKQMPPELRAEELERLQQIRP